ncbi:MAG: hypothetical protein KHZ58_14750 [Hungatella hathewayi]|nr:hypothetical protein [Hungatella hathewayi]
MRKPEEKDRKRDREKRMDIRLDAEYEVVVREIDIALAYNPGRQIVIAIDGRCGSGKTTLGLLLQEIYGCNLFHMDDFFLRPEQRTEERLQEIGGNVDYERFQSDVLAHLGDMEGLEYQRYDCGRQRLAETINAPHLRLNIVEGAYSQHPYFGDIYDRRFFLDIGEEEQISRILRRNGEFMLNRFQNEWIPMENRYFDLYQIKEQSICIHAPL